MMLFENRLPSSIQDDSIEDILDYEFDFTSSNIFSLKMFGNDIEGKVKSVKITDASISPKTVPEPSTYFLLSLGLLGLLFSKPKLANKDGKIPA